MFGVAAPTWFTPEAEPLRPREYLYFALESPERNDPDEALLRGGGGRQNAIYAGGVSVRNRDVLSALKIGDGSDNHVERCSDPPDAGASDFPLLLSDPIRKLLLSLA